MIHNAELTDAGLKQSSYNMGCAIHGLSWAVHIVPTRSYRQNDRFESSRYRNRAVLIAKGPHGKSASFCSMSI